MTDASQINKAGAANLILELNRRSKLKDLTNISILAALSIQGSDWHKLTEKQIRLADALVKHGFLDKGADNGFYGRAVHTKLE